MSISPSIFVTGTVFSVLYEEEFVEGEHIGSGNILAATFTNRGETFTAVRAESGKYYTPTGKAMKKSLLALAGEL